MNKSENMCFKYAIINFTLYLGKDSYVIVLEIN